MKRRVKRKERDEGSGVESSCYLPGVRANDVCPLPVCVFFSVVFFFFSLVFQLCLSVCLLRSFPVCSFLHVF